MDLNIRSYRGCYCDLDCEFEKYGSVVVEGCRVLGSRASGAESQPTKGTQHLGHSWGLSSDIDLGSTRTLA